jgi:hypothetical protein
MRQLGNHRGNRCIAWTALNRSTKARAENPDGAFRATALHQNPGTPGRVKRTGYSRAGKAQTTCSGLSLEKGERDARSVRDAGSEFVSACDIRFCTRELANSRHSLLGTKTARQLRHPFPRKQIVLPFAQSGLHRDPSSTKPDKHRGPASTNARIAKEQWIYQWQASSDRAGKLRRSAPTKRSNTGAIRLMK